MHNVEWYEEEEPTLTQTDYIYLSECIGHTITLEEEETRLTQTDYIYLSECIGHTITQHDDCSLA